MAKPMMKPVLPQVSGDSCRGPPLPYFEQNSENSVSSGYSSQKRAMDMVEEELAYLESMRDDPQDFVETFKASCEGLRYNAKVVKRHPRILVITLILFTVLCACGLSIVIYLANDRNIDEERAALDLAVDTGRWFSDRLDRAILPLFSLAQFVGEIDEFTNLAGRVASRSMEPGMSIYRNVSGVCNDEDVVKRFNDIASSIKENANMQNVLVSLQMVPHEVVCMVYPLNNTEDFEDGIFMDNQGAIGLDLLAIPSRIAYAESVLQSEDIYIAGPLTLRECADGGECNVSVEKAFIAALRIDSTDHTIAVGENIYNRWGSVEAIINWKALIDKSDIFESFEQNGKEFRLTRTDRIIDPETQEETTEVVILAETNDFDSEQHVQVSTMLDTVDDMWEMTIAYEQSSDKFYPYSIAVAVISAFLFSSLFFWVMLQKQKLSIVQKRYLEDLMHPQKRRFRLFLDAQKSGEPSPEMERQILSKKPIGDFFPQCTVLIADIAEFTCWSTEREPSQVFKLLQTVFFHFDKITRKRGAFKVDATGDVYVAVAGLPDPQPDHAIIMTKLAQECLHKFNSLTKELEKKLGPETANLKMRIGIASGPVIGGVLLGGSSSKIRILGTTCSTAKQMEVTSKPNRIQLSEKTAELLTEAGKKKWMEIRKQKVFVKDVGEVQTYFLTQRRKGSNEESSSKDISYCSDLSIGTCEIWDEEDVGVALNKKVDIQQKKLLLIDWQVESLLGLLKMIVAYRNKGKKAKVENFSLQLQKGETVLDEVKEIIHLPDIDRKKSAIMSKDLESVQISPVVQTQLRSFVERIAGLYHDNPFHNFEHANHVTMAVHKLLNRIVTPEAVNYDKSSRKLMAELHDHTFGITSDPLTHFAVAFSALIHDCDHIGVGNPQLSKEKPAMGEKYKYQSVAEQNSVELAWDLLMQPDYADLQKCIFSTQEEYLRFRALVVNTVLATDIFDPELKALRNMRWETAFHSEEFRDITNTSLSSVDEMITVSTNTMESKQILSASTSAPPTWRDQQRIWKDRQRIATNRKATIVIEHIIQASDVCHTMQHWNVYKRWNEKLFQEMYLAFKMGRSTKDPSLGWYKGELWFFDNYVIPLAKKLDECGVFGVASDECLFHAIENRREWVARGEEVVKEMIERLD